MSAAAAEALILMLDAIVRAFGRAVAEGDEYMAERFLRGAFYLRHEIWDELERLEGEQ